MEPPEKGTRSLKMDLCPVKQDVDLITMTYGFKTAASYNHIF